MKKEFTFNLYYAKENDFETIMEQVLLNYIKKKFKDDCVDDLYNYLPLRVLGE